MTKVLIWGKTYPELSSSYKETVCTGGCLEDGTPVRVYPVPLRYLDAASKYKLYEWVEINLEKSPSDARPESYRMRGSSIQRVGAIDTKHHWRERQRFIHANTSWHYNCLADLYEAQKEKKTSLGFVRVGSVEKVYVERRSPEDEKQHYDKLRELQSQGSLFGDTVKHLRFLPARVHLRWRCACIHEGQHCPGHSAGILDWGLAELAHREGIDKARQRIEALTNLDRHDLALFMGNFKSHQNRFGIVGLWYPTKPPPTSQLALPGL